MLSKNNADKSEGGIGTPGRIRTCDLRISLPLQISLPTRKGCLWSGPYLHHLRCSTYGLYGSLPQKSLCIVSFLGIAIINHPPRGEIILLRFHRYSAVHFAGSCFPTKAPIFVEVRCSIQLSYRRIPISELPYSMSFFTSP